MAIDLSLDNVTENTLHAGASKVIASLSKTDEGRRILADQIRKYVEKDLTQSDVAGVILTKETLRDGETPRFVTRKGIKAYVHEPGSYAPKSMITQESIVAYPELISANPEVLINQLRSGRVGDIQYIRRRATAEIIGKKNSITFNTILGAVPDTSEDNYAECTTEVDKLALNAAMSYVSDVAGGVKAIIGRGPAVDPIADFEGFSDATQEQIDKKGQLGSYRGARIVRLKQYVDADGVATIPEDEILVIGDYVGHAFTVGDMGAEQALDVNTLLWNIHLYEQFGCVVIYADRIYRIHIT